jgi:hypothetical protein
MKRAVLFLALLASSLPAIPQQLAAVGPVQTAQANPAPPPAPQPPQSPPPKPSTASPGEDTGMAGQVAQEGVVLPTVGAVSASAIVLGLGVVVAAGVALSNNGDGDNAAPTATTGTR